jgi:Mce-associated membrane protein
MFTVSGDAERREDSQSGVDLGALAKSLTELAQGLSELAAAPAAEPVAGGPADAAGTNGTSVPAAAEAPAEAGASSEAEAAPAVTAEVAAAPAEPAAALAAPEPDAAVVAGTTSGPAPARPHARRNAILRLAAATVAVALVIAALVYVGLRLRHEDSLASARKSGLTAARAYALDIATYDYKTLDQDFGRVTSHATAGFKQKFDQSSALLRDLLVKYQAHATGNVIAAGVESATTNRVVAVLFVDQLVTNTNDKQPVTNRNRLEITVERHGGHWQIANVNLL